MINNSVSSDLAIKRDDEIKATKDLTHLLNRSATARTALRVFASEFGVDLPEQLHYKAEVSGDGGRPDISGSDKRGTHIIVEGKFWAYLTQHQPVSYFNYLSEDSCGLLLFVAPAMRLSALWTELKEVCDEEAPGGLKHHDSKVDGYKSYAATFQERYILALCSWRSLLHALSQALKESGEIASLKELQERCENMDNPELLPLHPQDLAPSRGRQMYQLETLVEKVLDDAFDEMNKLGQSWLAVGKKDLALGDYGYDLKIHDQDCWLGVSSELWGWGRPETVAPGTPLWLTFTADSDDPGRLGRLQQAFRDLERREERLSSEVPDPDGTPALCVALDLPTGVDERQVVHEVVRQLKEIADLLKPS